VRSHFKLKTTLKVIARFKRFYDEYKDHQFPHEYVPERFSAKSYLRGAYSKYEALGAAEILFCDVCGEPMEKDEAESYQKYVLCQWCYDDVLYRKEEEAYYAEQKLKADPSALRPK
jgi:hypothetical protein